MGYTLIAEGKANEIWRTPSNALIRVSKRGVMPSEIASYWNGFWRPKLGKYMGQLETIEDPLKGPVLLIDEVGSKGAKIVAEFKPKWLHQSAEAPAEARSCRTCAIKTMRQQENSWCSLDLAFKDPEGLRKCMNSVALPEYVEQCVQLLLSIDLLDRLTFWQAKLATTENFLDCMSLRDCTIIIEHSPDSGYACWLVDLDPKGGPGKMQKWSRIEAQLKPYYLAYNPVCRLSRT